MVKKMESEIGTGFVRGGCRGFPDNTYAILGFIRVTLDSVCTRNLGAISSEVMSDSFAT